MSTHVKHWVGLLLLVLGTTTASAQTSPPADPTEPVAKFKDLQTFYWLNTYGNIRIKGRFFWVAQTHFRFTESPQREFIGQWAQLYNRHAVSYLVNSHFNVSLGGVARINFNTSETSEGQRMRVPEWRIWHEYLWSQHLFNGKVYHRVRLEHRWTRGFNDTNPNWIFRNRWRYMVAVKHPINRHHLEPGAFYIGPEAEVILQSGKAVVGSPLEDLRLHGSLGYIASAKFTFAAGLMYSLGQDLADGGIYKQKLTLRTHVYFTPDWRTPGAKLPPIHLRE